MPRMPSFLRRDKGPGIDEVLDDQDGDWHPDYIKSRILDLDEHLHLQTLRHKIFRALLAASSIALIAFTAYTIKSQAPIWPPEYDIHLYVSTFLVVLISPALLYWQYKRTRATRLTIKKLNLIRRRLLAEGTQTGDTESGSPLANQKRYRDDALDLIAQLQEDANRNRRTHNRFQAVVIIGSVFSSATATASVSYSQTRWLAVGITAAVGLAAGFTGYYKYHERGFSDQQAADAIEREYEAVELRVGKYANKSEEDAYAIFADAVERLRDEHSKRQQQLDQPAEVKREDGPGR